MSDDNRMSTQQLGRTLGKDLAAQKNLGSIKMREARQLVEAIFENAPSASAPRVLANDLVKEWQARTGVSDHHIRKALSAARKEVPKKTVKSRPRLRSKPAAAPEHASLKLSDRGIVENRDIGLL